MWPASSRSTDTTRACLKVDAAWLLFGHTIRAPIAGGSADAEPLPVAALLDAVFLIGGFLVAWMRQTLRLPKFPRADLQVLT